LRRIAVTDSERKAWAEQLEEEVSRTLKDMPEYQKLLSLYRDLLLAQNEAKGRLAPVGADIDKKRVAELARAGKTLLDEVDAKLDTEAARALFDELKDSAPGHGDDFAEEVGKIDEAIESGTLKVGEVLEEIFSGGSAEDLKKKVIDMELDPHFFALLAFSAVRPGLEAYSEKLLSLFDETDWERKSCPVCGRMPYIAKLVGEEGKRVLCCPACSAEWRYPRIKCVNCGNEDQKKLRMLSPEGHGRDRYAEVCDACKRYVKIIDTRKLARQPIMQVADAVTLHLDLLAQREGFVTL
jgi:FdhE protein